MYHAVFYHQFGTEQKDDIIVAAFPHKPTYILQSGITNDGNYFITYATPAGETKNMIYYSKLADFDPSVPMKLIPIIDEPQYDFRLINNDGPVFTFLTTADAPTGRLIRVDITEANALRNKANWQEIIPADANRKLYTAIVICGCHLIVIYNEDIKHNIYLYTINGELIKNLTSGTISSLIDIYGRKDLNELFYSLSTYSAPAIHYRYDLDKFDNTEPEIFRYNKPNSFDQDEIVTEQIFYQSYDGVMIPMFLVKHRDTVLSSNTPTLLYSYGGFAHTLYPGYSDPVVLFTKYMNGLYVQANLRGGGEYGADWHEQGKLLNKQNTFNDLFAAAEYLFAKNMTSPSKLAIKGESNGGLTVMASALQRPELFKAVISIVGVHDLLRFHLFTIGYGWVPEYGDIHNETEFNNLYKISPLHNIKVLDAPLQYPAMVLNTADHDDRVVPSHTLKFIAQMYHQVLKMKQQRNPILCRIDADIGHGSGAGKSRIIAKVAEQYTFIAKVLDMKIDE